MNRTRTVATDLFMQMGFKNSLELAVKAEAVLMIKAKMDEQKLTQAALARQIGWRSSRLSDLLRGRLDLFSYDAINEVLAPFKAVIEVTPKLVAAPRRSRTRPPKAAA